MYVERLTKKKSQNAYLIVAQKYGWIKSTDEHLYLKQTSANYS